MASSKQLAAEAAHASQTADSDQAAPPPAPFAGIVPSVGRKVWYYEDGTQPDPFDATIIKVHAPAVEASPTTRVNLFVVDDSGHSFPRFNVSVGDEQEVHEHYRWMPYQQKQAAKAEASE